MKIVSIAVFDVIAIMSLVLYCLQLRCRFLHRYCSAAHWSGASMSPSFEAIESLAFETSGAS